MVEKITQEKVIFNERSNRKENEFSRIDPRKNGRFFVAQKIENFFDGRNAQIFITIVQYVLDCAFLF